MTRHKHAVATLLLAVIATFVVVAAILVVSGRGKTSGLETLIMTQNTADGEIASDAPAASDDSSTLMLFRVDGTQTVASDRFMIDLPAGWSVTGADSIDRAADGTLLYGWLYNAPTDDITNSDLVRISISDVAKADSTFDDVVAAHAWDDADASEIVRFMSTEASELFPDYSASDVKVSLEDASINGFAVKRNMLQCLKPCYIEGAAQTDVIYFFDASDRVYLLSVYTNTLPATADFLNAADAVVRTFRLR